MLDSVSVGDLDNYRAPASIFFHASRCSSEIVGLRETGIVSVVQQLAYRRQCLSLVPAFVTFHRVSPACQAAELSDVVVPKFGADLAMAGGELSRVPCLTWSMAIFGVGRTGGRASAVVG